MNPQLKQPRIICKPYIDWIIQQPTCSSNHTHKISGQIVPAHQTNGYGIMGGKGHDICALPLYHSQHMIEHTKGHDFFWGHTNTSRLILDHLARYSDETGNTFWAPMDLYAVMVNFVVRRWIDDEEKKKINKEL